jgi:UDP-perosamine 4-acetyltransferase
VIKVVGLGAGGHAQVVMDALRLSGGAQIVGLLSVDRDAEGTTIDGVPIIGGDERLPALRGEGVTHAIVTVGSLRPSGLRRRLFGLIADAGLIPLTVIHPSAIVARSASIGRGTVVLAGAIVNASATVGDNVILNTAAVVEHHGRIGDHVHVATGARLGGGVTVGAGAHVGLGANILQGIGVGTDAIVGAGAVVTRDVAAGVTVIGVPASVKSR